LAEYRGMTPCGRVLGDDPDEKEKAGGGIILAANSTANKDKRVCRKGLEGKERLKRIWKGRQGRKEKGRWEREGRKGLMGKGMARSN
jgi:hypothetical protein